MAGGIAQLKRIILLVISTVSCGWVLHAQDMGYNLSRFTPADGLAASEINTLFQDSQHSMWIGHKAGVSRYNGYAFENLLFAGDQRVGIVYAIIEAEDGTIWIGAEEGLFYYKNKRLMHLNLQMHTPPIYALAFDARNDLWIGAGEGLAVLSAALLHKAIHKNNNTAVESIIPCWYPKPENCRRVKFISVPANDLLFISDGHTIFRYDKKEVSRIHTIANDRDYITGMIALNKDSVYLSSQLSGFWILKKQTVERLYFSKGIGNALNFSNGRLLYFAVEGIYSIDYRTNNVRLLISLPEQYQEWGSAVWQDKENNFWIGTHEELLVARPLLFNQIHLPALKGLDELYSLHLHPDGSLLLGGNRGKVFKRDIHQDSFALWKMVFPLAEVFDIHTSANGDTWFCSGYQGISLLRNGILKRYTIQDGLRSNSNYKFLATTTGDLFVCGDNGVTKIITSPDGGIMFKNYYLGPTGSAYTVVSSILEKPDRSLLFGSDHGLLEWKIDSLYATNIKGSLHKAPSVTDIKQDGSGNVWISTVGDGILLCRFESDNSLVLKKKFTVADGLPAMIYLQLLPDSNNILWATSYKEVTRIEQKPDQSFFIASFGHSYGFLNNSFHAVRMLQDKEGVIWIATSSGLMNFNPATLSHSIHPPVIRLDAVSFPPNKKYARQYSDSLPSQDIRLPYNFGSITFHFTSIYLSDPSSVRYTYRLQGTDSNWIDAGTERMADFQNLAPGRYTFEVKASLGNTIWSNTSSYRFTILPPFWQRWWFIFIAILAATGLLLYFIRRRERMIRRKEAEKTEMEKLKAISYQYQLEIEQVVNYFANVISQQKKIDDLLWDVTRNCMSKLGFEDCVIYLIEEPAHLLVQKAAWGPKTTVENKILNPIEIPLGKGIVGAVAVSGKPEIIADTRKDSRYIVDDMHRISEISVPIISDGKPIGVIDSEHSQPGFYTERHLQILTTIAALCADKINKIKAEEKTRAKEIEVLKLNNDLTASQLIALRSQMNPHFIFNSLNSIAQLVASMQNELGLEYLNKFAALLRLILEESENNFIALKDEIKILDLYLQLESLRFGSSFVYTIHTDHALDEEDTMLPSFIIHPIVENAIWHGLLHKEGDRRLIIDFRKKNNEELLCMVKDNGIGVEAAKARKQKMPGSGKQQSKGLQMVYDRLQILGQQYNTPSSLLIEDLNDNGHISGTKVTIHLPIIYDL